MTKMRSRATAYFITLTMPAVFAICLAGGVARAEGPATAPSRPTTQPIRVAILDFSTSGKAAADLGKQIPDALSALLSDQAGFQLVERAEISKLLVEQAANLTGLTEADKSVKVGRLVGAQVLITGKMFPLDHDLYITAKIIGTETSVVKAVMVKGKSDAEMGELLVAASQKIAATLSAHGQDLLPGGPPPDPIAALKARLATKRRPTLAVSVSEKHQAAARQPADPAVETEIRRVLSECGFTVLDASADRKADLNITGEALSEFGALLGSLTACSARAEVKVVEAQAGNIRFTSRTTTRAADLSETIAAKSALQKAGHMLAVELATNLAETLPDEKKP